MSALAGGVDNHIVAMLNTVLHKQPGLRCTAQVVSLSLGHIGHVFRSTRTEHWKTPANVSAAEMVAAAV